MKEKTKDLLANIFGIGITIAISVYCAYIFFKGC